MDISSDFVHMNVKSIFVEYVNYICMHVGMEKRHFKNRCVVFCLRYCLSVDARPESADGGRQRVAG